METSGRRSNMRSRNTARITIRKTRIALLANSGLRLRRTVTFFIERASNSAPMQPHIWSVYLTMICGFSPALNWLQR
jgi:hypothetical protein